MLLSALMLSVLLAIASSSHAAPAPVDSKSTGLKQFTKTQIQDEEQQLETLKNQGKNIAVVNSQIQSTSNVNGHVQSVAEKETKVQDTKSGKTLAQIKQDIVETRNGSDNKPDKIIKTTVDIPNKGFHRSAFTRNGKPLQLSESKETPEDYYTQFEGVQYTPGDMAEYIFRTGDDDGVSLAIEELVREGLLSQEDAISYLEEVRVDLEMLKAQEEKNNRLRAFAARRNALGSQESREVKVDSPFRGRFDSQSIDESEEKRMLLTPINLRQAAAIEEKRQFRQNVNTYHRKGLLNDDDQYENNANSDLDYEDLLQKVRLADFLSKEFSLEEVIYQLAKQMFTQSVIRGNNDAEEALQRFTIFLQQETAKGRISPELQSKVIDVLLAALMDTIGEHPELASIPNGLSIPRNFHPEAISDTNSSGQAQERSKVDIAKTGSQMQTNEAPLSSQVKKSINKKTAA